MKTNGASATNFSTASQAYWSAQPRAVRIFNPALEILWDNTPERMTLYPLYHDGQGRAVELPPAGDPRNAWPVWRALEERRLHERNYWLNGKVGEPGGCYRVRAYPLEGAELLVAEETERMDSALCQNERLRQIDQQLAEMMEGVADFILNHADPSILRLRLANPDLQPCHKVRQCRRKSCPAYGNENLRCWEIPNTQCHGADGPAGGLAKIRECNHCEVYRMACGAPLTRVGENFNRLLHFLQLKYEETIEMHGRVQQSEKLAALGEMTMCIAHEIKNPLSVISSRLDCLRLEQETLRPADLAEDLEVLASQAGRMRHFLEGLLALARPAEIEHQPLDLNEVIRSTLPLLGKMLEKNAVRVESHLDGGLPTIVGDAVSIQQILLNLILNAREAMPRGGTIRINSRVNPEEPAEVLVEVKDGGHGIAAREIKKVFQPFYSTKAGRGGTGLGLAICTRIMSQHGGRISVKSRLGHGATFTLAFKKM